MNEDINLVIDKLELKKTHFNNNGNELWAICPFHSDRNPTNFSISLLNGLYYCFACQASGNIINLLFNKEENYTTAIKLWNLVKKEEVTDIQLPSEPISLDEVNSFKSNGFSEYALDRLEGNEEILKLYNIYSDKKGNPIFFINNRKNETMGLWVRENDNYYLIQPLREKEYCYGEHIRPDDKLILCEGHFDAPNVFMKTGIPAWSLMGTSYSQEQLKHIKETGSTIYLFLDGDSSGRLARKSLFLDLYLDCDVRVCGGYQGDPDEQSKDRIFEILDNSLTWNNYLEMIK